MAAIRSQEASSSTSPCSYHVFLSFRGEDTRKSFTDHLYTALDHAGFRTFRDDDGIERGEKIKSELQKAIRESRMSIVVLSKNYASSSWCLDELVMILRRRSTSGHVVLPIFYDVDPSQVRKQMGSFKEAFKRHEGKIEAESGERRKEWMSKVGEWRAALKEVADLAGMNLQNTADGHESRFIQKIIKIVGDKLSRTILDISPFPIGIHSRAREIQFWLEDHESADVGVVAICGMGGIGKTTIAKFLYNYNFLRFDGSSFLANVREISKQQDGLLCLQRQLVSDILKGREEKISNVDEGIVKIKDALRFKRVLVILDDVDKPEQLYAVLGMRDWLFPGSKIIITTRNEHLVRVHEGCKVHRIIELDFDESLELFSLHAFGQSHPIDDYADTSELVVQHCGGLPLAIKVLGSSLSGKSIGVWKSHLQKLKAFPNTKILEKLKISYDSLEDDHDKSLFLHLACFFVGRDKDFTITIMDECEFYTVVGIENLIDRCLVTVEYNKVVIHHLLQEMGREIVRQESPNEPGERSRLCSHKDSFNVLRHNTGTRKIEDLILDMSLLKANKSARTVFGVNRKRSLEEFLDDSLLSNVWNSLKRYRLGIFSQNSVGNPPADSNEIALETNAFAKMENLKLLQLGHVQISGSYENFPKKIKWLCWHGFPFESIPRYFPLEAMVALEMPYSSLKHFSAGTKFLDLLKIINLSHSHSLASTPDFIVLPNLEKLILEDCSSLVEIHESLGHLARLVLLNLKDCSNLRKLPRSIGMLKSLGTLDISGCSNLENLPTEMGNMDSLTVLRAEMVTGITRSPATIQNVKAWFILPLKPKRNPETSWASSLPQSLVKLNLVGCNLSDDAFPKDLSNLSLLRELDLRGNPIISLPDCIRGLTGLVWLNVSGCTRLRSLVMRQDLLFLQFLCCWSLEKITPVDCNKKLMSPGDNRILDYWYGRCHLVVEFYGIYKLEPLGDVDKEITDNLGLFDLGSMRNLKVRLEIPFCTRLRHSLQGCHSKHVFSTYLPGSKVPEWFNLTNKGTSLSFAVPSHNFRIRGLSLCVVYENSCDYIHSLWVLNSVISNTTKRLIWSHWPQVTGIPEADGDMIWLSYWKFENQVEGGDEMNIFVKTIGFQVKELGVRLLYDVEKAEEIKQEIPSTSEEVSEEELFPYGVAVPGNASSYDQENTQVYAIGIDHIVDIDKIL